MNPAPQLPLRVCPKHGLVAGRDGRCVICHRDDAGSEQERGNLQILGWAVAFAVIFGGIFAWKMIRDVRAAAPAVVRAETSAPVARPPPVEDEAPAPRSFDETRAAVRSAAEQERQREIEAEMRRIMVKMYVVKKCEMCDAARAQLKQKGMTYTEIDVDGDPSALEALRKLTPSTQVPVFDVDGEVVVGFGPTSVTAAVRRAAEKRKPRWSRP